MRKAGTFPTPTSIILVVGLVLGGVLAGARPTLAQAQDDCALPDGVTPPEAPPVTAQQVEDGSATLMEFTLAAKNQFSLGTESLAQSLYIGCLIRQDGSHWHSGSTYIVQLTPDGRVLVQSKDMTLSGRLLNPLIYAGILQAAGINLADLLGLTDPAEALAAFAGAAAGDGGPFEVPGVTDASGYATVFISGTLGVPIVLVAGFDLDESHLIEEVVDFGNPTVTASDVVDRETLKTFVTLAGEFILESQQSNDLAAVSKLRIATRDEDGPWRHGPVYLYILDLASNIILFHGAFPDRFELRPLVPTVRDVVTGELVLPQVIAAAASSPEGGFLEYHWDDPADDSDRADIPKVGYARQFKGEFVAGERVTSIDFIVGSGFYHSAVSTDVSTGDLTEGVASTSGLAPAVPNPFNTATQIAYNLGSPGPVQLMIYNVLGQRVRTLVDRFQGAGSYQVRWDARNQQGALLSSGVYITRLSFPGGVHSQRLLYLK